MPSDPPPLPRRPTWRTSLTVPAPLADAFEAVLADCCEALSSRLGRPGTSILAGYGPQRPDRAQLETRAALLAAALGAPTPAIDIERLETADWLAESLAGFPPLRIGRIRIRGSHVREPAPPGTIDLVVDATIAFGTGEHPTTAGCLLALQRLAKRRRPARCLDMGCGTGILAVAAAKLFRCPVLAVDLSPDAVAVARHTARVNGVRHLVEVTQGDGYRGVSTPGGTYDLILSNILAGPLAAMAGACAAALRPAGWAVLSGLLDRQERWVTAAHRARGLRLAGRQVVASWPTLVMERRGSPPRSATAHETTIPPVLADHRRASTILPV